MRQLFFGPAASTAWARKRLEQEIPRYRHIDADIRNVQELERIFRNHGGDVLAVIHLAAQPSHDWSGLDPLTDFSINANGTLNLLDHTRRFCPDATFIFMSTNKVYGDSPNALPLIEHETRWEISPEHRFAAAGIDETMSTDQCLHSLFGCSKLAADLLVQEYGRYFGLNTVCFRAGCLTGSGHSAAKLHGFLAYLVSCAVTRTPYEVYGYQAKQVRDNIHSSDLVAAFWHVFLDPKSGVVYNIGGGRDSNCSILEAFELCERLTGNPVTWSYTDQARIGDHMWWISDSRRFRNDYPDWKPTLGIEDIISEIHGGLSERLRLRGAL